MSMNDLHIPEDIKRYIDFDAANGCWLWTGAKTKAGYGNFIRRIDGKNKQFYAHRHIYQLKNGPIKKGLFCCHRCDVRHCCNPDHIFIGSAADNLHDCLQKGRHRVSNPISDETKKMVRDAYAAGTYKVYEVEKLYSLSSTSIIKIIKGYPGSWYTFKFKPEFIKEIVELYNNNNFSYREIGLMYNLKDDVIGRIVRNNKHEGANNAN